MRAWLVILMLAFPLSAQARRTVTHDYRYEQVWTTAVRLLRVDYGFTIRDRDRDIGYLLFDYRDHGRTYPASLELVRSERGGREQIRVTLNVPAMPSYVERMILDKLQRKLREELGEPLRPRPEAEPEEDDDENEADSDEAAGE